MARNIKKVIKEEVDDYDETKQVYFFCLVGSDAGDRTGKGLPRDAHYIFDIKTEIELKIHQIIFLSCRDLLEYYRKHTGLDGEGINVYDLVMFFVERNPNGYYFVDEVPLIKDEGNYRIYF